MTGNYPCFSITMQQEDSIRATVDFFLNVCLHDSFPTVTIDGRDRGIGERRGAGRV